MAQIHDPLQQAEGLLTRLKPLAERYLPDAQAVLEDLQARLKQNSLQVMLLGAYNAGKSTVVNLLLGEVQARIGDIPTTDVVDAYPWGGHVLLDTPGVNAPIEHEQVSNQALERTDLVLFVIRQEDQDSENIIGRLLDLVAQGRPVFVLLNHDASSEDAQELQAHLIRVMVQLATRRGLDMERVHRVPVLMLNAASALKGRLEHKKLLLEASGYESFVERFNQWLVAYAPARERVKVLRDAVARRVVEPIRLQLAPQAGQEDELLRATRKQTGVEQERALFMGAVGNQVRLLVNGVRMRIRGIIGNGGGSEEALGAINAIALELQDSMQAWLLAQPGFHARLETYQAEQVRLASAGLNVVVDEPVCQPATGVEEAFLNLGRQMDESAVSALLHLGRKLKLPVLKGRWSSTLNKWATKGAGAIQVATTVWEVGSALKQQRDANQAAHQFEMQCQQCLDEACCNLVSSLEQWGGALVRDVYAGELEAACALCGQLATQADERARDLASLETLAGDWTVLAAGSQLQS